MLKENQSIGTWHILIGTILILSISPIASEWLIGSEWERHFDVFRPRQDDGAY